MLAMFSPVSLEAQKLISVSISKINASRVTRTGTSLHKSLLVASVLHKARNVYLEEERERTATVARYSHQYATSSSELTVTPVCQLAAPSCSDHHPPSELTVTPLSQLSSDDTCENGDSNHHVSGRVVTTCNVTSDGEQPNALDNVGDRRPYESSSSELTVTPMCRAVKQPEDYHHTGSRDELTVTPICSVINKVIESAVETEHSSDSIEFTSKEDEVATAEKTGRVNNLPVCEANTSVDAPQPQLHLTVDRSSDSSSGSSGAYSTSPSSTMSRKRRRVSDQETAAAVSSILPKRLRSELKEENLRLEECNRNALLLAQQTETELLEQRQASNKSASGHLNPSKKRTHRCSSSQSPKEQTSLAEEESLPSERHDNLLSSPGDATSLPEVDVREDSSAAASELVHTSVTPDCGDSSRDPSTSSREDTSSSSDDSDSDDSASDTSSSSGGEEEMEVEQLTSLVSYFSFSQSQQQQSCISPLHSAAPHVLALTAA